MAMGFAYIATDKDTDFEATLAENAILSESIDMPTDWQTADIQKCIISEMSVQSDENLDWELLFWANGDYNNTDLDLSKVITRISLAATTADQIAGSNQYIYDNPLAQSIEYVDEDNTSKIHISLINRSASAKSADPNGSIVIRIGCTPYFS